MKKIKIGVLISNNENKVIGYSFEKGFFICKELFFEKDFYKNNLSDDTIWFSNIKEENIRNRNIKSNDFFDIKITDIILHYGLSNVKIGNSPNFKIILKKLFDFLNIFVENHISSFKKSSLEKVNPKSIIKREDKRTVDFLNAKTYKELLLSIKNDYDEKLITNIIHREQKKYNILPFWFYNEKTYIDNDNSKINSIIDSKKLVKEEMQVLNKKTSFVKIDTFNLEALNEIEEKDFFNIKNYKISNLGSSFNIDKKNKDILKIEEVLFYLIKITKAPNIRIFKNLLNTNQWVSKKELEFYLTNDFSLSIDYICEREKSKTEPLFNFNTVALDDAITPDIRNSHYHQVIHLHNYLQIIEISDNNILNKWIKSSLKSKTMKIIALLEKSDIEVIEYNYNYIKISYNVNEKERLREKLESLKINYPSLIL